jgi:transposase
VARHRGRWRVWQRYMDGARFVFIDETAATTAMTRLYGWGPRGERLVDAVPAGHWKTTTVVAGLRASGIIAPFVLDGPMTGAVFRAGACPRAGGGRAGARACAGAGRRGRDGQSLHAQEPAPAEAGVAGVKEAIRAVGASVLYLPSYSPDLNPIEQLFAKLKALLRKAAAKTQDALWETIGTSLEAFTPAECQNYIVNSGYEFV